MEDLVTIIIPIYNVEKYLGECLDSVLNQTYKNLEIILVNDGSTDNSLEICKKYYEKDKRIKIINQENQGVAISRNVGLDNSTGKYIAYIDSDDIVEKKYIETLLKIERDYNADIISCDFLKFKNYKDIIKDTKERVIKSFNKKQALESLLYQKDFDSSLWNKLIKKEMFKDLKFNNYRVFEDLDIMYKIFGNANKIIHINKKMYFYRMRSQSLITKKFDEKNLMVEEIGINMKNYITERFPSLENACNSRLLAIYYYIYRNIDNKNIFYKKCVEEIKKLRKVVIKDKKIKTKVKVGIILSMINMKFIKLQNIIKV